MTKEFDDAFSFYLAYHSNPVNQWIHILCVWPILFTAQILLAYSSSFTPYLPKTLVSYLPSFLVLNFNLLFTIRYMSHYAYIEQPGIAGVLASVLVFLGYLFSLHIVEAQNNVWVYAIAIHVFCWAAQIYGHKVHEKRQPAFMDNLQQALITAPLFVLMEVMCDFFGYKSEFKKKMQAIASENIKAYKQSLKKVQ